MKREALAALIVVAATSTGCATRRSAEPVGTEQRPAEATSSILDARGQPVATVVASDAGDALRIRVDATGLSSGVYGIHLHSVGRCEAPGFETAGPHWNPAGREHGRDNPRGQHLGDLPNLLVGTDRRGTLEFTIPGASLGGPGARLLDADGAAIVLHARPDDYRTDPSGNSGSRIACGVLG